MTQGNFNWFLHTMLFYHTRYVIRKQEIAKDSTEREDNEMGEDTQTKCMYNMNKPDLSMSSDQL